ncbi:hypothetical protein N7452_001310 [Penicillium brevicompactum]|uniref:C2H2-type domain-containing protein n=1 Tax=Penicillium brevicompactum TaxID=5074 RepID=A0A9W9R273_PENBR|nr:hypothetical protein N7452_001310 [Penicillium brevicompactum]
MTNQHSIMQPTGEVELWLRRYECWFCPSEWIGFSALLEHLETSRCVKEDRIRTLAFECPEYGFYGNRLTDPYPFFCFQCHAQFTQISALFYHVERNGPCSYLLGDGECLGNLRDFYIEYYDCPGCDSLGY